MLKQKRTKVSRHRGSSSHGGGHKKKRRGAGHRGGVGLSGSGARGDQKKSMILRKFGHSYFGKKGFTSIHKKSNKVLSLAYLENNFDKLVEAGVIVQEEKEFVFDSTIFKYDKILGSGVLTKALTIVCNEISDSAKAKVEEDGGKVVVLAASSDSEEPADSSEE